MRKPVVFSIIANNKIMFVPLPYSFLYLEFKEAEMFLNLILIHKNECHMINRFEDIFGGVIENYEKYPTVSSTRIILRWNVVCMSHPL